MSESEYKYCRKGHLKTPENTVGRGCKICKLETTRLWRENNKERVQAYVEENREKKNKRSKERYQENKDSIKPWQKEHRAKPEVKAKNQAQYKIYYEENKEKESARKQKWFAENKEYMELYREFHAERYAAQKKKWNEDNYELVKDSQHRRRAAKKNVKYERIDLKGVFAECGMTCGICKERVDFRLKHPDPKSPSIDHIIPLSKGGTHTYENVQLTHLVCNLRKSDKIIKSDV